MILALAVSLLLDCKPVEQNPFTARGNTKRGLTLELTKKSMTLREAKAALWTADDYWFAVMFAEDDSWVAVKGPYPVGSIAIAPTSKGAKLTVVDPMEHLSAEERKRIPETSCGTSWFKGWKNTPKALELTVDQGAEKAVTLHVTPDGKVSR